MDNCPSKLIYQVRHSTVMDNFRPPSVVHLVNCLLHIDIYVAAAAILITCTMVDTGRVIVAANDGDTCVAAVVRVIVKR